MDSNIKQNFDSFSLITYQPNWRQSGRAHKWNPFKKVQLKYLWLVQVGTAMILWWLIVSIIRLIAQIINNILLKLPYAKPIPFLNGDPTIAIAIVLLILMCLSPWLIDGLLRLFYGLKPLSMPTLSAKSPEATKMIQRFCHQKEIPLPKLGIIPTAAPIALTYGNLPRNARIVISQGLWKQLADDEIAAIYAGELGHIIHKDFMFMSLIILILQLPYTIYWQVAKWEDIIKNNIQNGREQNQKFLVLFWSFYYYCAALISTISYGLYWILRFPVLLFSRMRVYYSDRCAVEVTGNPNGLTRALLKIAIGITKDIQKQRSTSWLLEGFDLLMPLGHRQALTLGSCYCHKSFEDIIAWDCRNPYRHWLILNYSHPLTGDRLYVISRYAQYWQLETELDLPPVIIPERNIGVRIIKLLINHKALPLIQNTLIYALLMGLIMSSLFWITGWIGDGLNISQVIWMHKTSNLVPACIMIGFSLSIFLQINGYFPDIKPTNAQTESILLDLSTNPDSLPGNSQTIRFSGNLLGRRGMSNWLGQDLILETSKGLVKLHFLLGLWGNFWYVPIHPVDLLDRQITATGWLRRGVTPWVDVDTLRSKDGITTKADYSIWVTILSCLAALSGVYLIWHS